MRSFVRSLSKATTEYENDIDLHRRKSMMVENKFSNLLARTKRSLIVKPKSAIQKPTTIPKVQPKKSKTVRESTKYDDFDLPFDTNEKNLKYRGVSAKNAKRYYDSDISNKLYNDAIQEYVDIQKHPNPSIEPLYRPQIDTFLHVGEFSEFEMTDCVKTGLPLRTQLIFNEDEVGQQYQDTGDVEMKV